MELHRSRYYSALTAGLLLFALTLPLSKSAGNVLLFLLAIIGVAGIFLDKDFKESVFSNSRQPLTLAFFLSFFVAFVGILFTEKYCGGYYAARKFLSLPAIYFMVSVLIQAVHEEEKRRQKAENILFSFLIGLMVLNVIGVMTFLGIVGNKQYVLALAPLNVNPIWFSNVNALGLYAAVSFLLFSRRGESTGGKLFLFFSVALSVLCILLSLSRSAWFGIILTSLIMTFLVSRNKKVFFITVAAAALACVTAYNFIPIVQQRIDQIPNDIARFSAGETYTSLGERFLMWKAALMMFLSNPLMGVGTGDYVPTMITYVKSGQFPEFLLEYNQPHNMYLLALATNGLLGLASLLYIFYRVLLISLPRMRGDEGERLFAFLAVATAAHFLTAGLADSFFDIQILRYSFVFIMGVCVRGSLMSASSPSPTRF